MKIGMLDEKENINLKSEFKCRYIKRNHERFGPHYHNYYELLLIVKGSGYHTSNGIKQLLQEGSLLFVRDHDVHSYISEENSVIEHINLAFTRNTLNMLFEYLGKGFPSENLLLAKTSPLVILSEREKNKLYMSLSELTSQNNHNLMKFKMRTILVNIFAKYFVNYSEQETDIPLWLELTYEKMKKPENFIAGFQKMNEISGRSREHLSRSMKKYYNISPSEYITELRLEHCKNFLLSSNLPITDICYECGFENISWFYKVFQKNFNMSPKQYRNKFSQKNI